MNEETLNTSIRTFLKRVGITSQREIEKTVRAAAAAGRLAPGAKMPAKMTLSIESLGLALVIEGEIDAG